MLLVMECKFNGRINFVRKCDKNKIRYKEK